MFIGDKNYLYKGIESQSLALFLENHVFKKFDYAFVEPDIRNLTGIKNYEHAGFSDFKIFDYKVWMVASKRITRISTLDMIAIELAFKQNWLPSDSLWVFGSRANLAKKGGDIDLYIETQVASMDHAFKMKQNFTVALIHKIGDQKIDIVLNLLKYPKNLPIYQVAKDEGVKVV
jgi:hypothetical protein